jgi:hypothetical protein
MPCIVPSHQAPVLPLKLWKPHWFSGLALCLGTMVPDLVFILRLDNDSTLSHGLAAQLYLTVPLVLLGHWLVTTLLLPGLLPFLPSGAPGHLHELAALRPPRSLRDLLVISTSGLLGGLTHIALDGFTHPVCDGGWAVALLPVLSRPVPHPGGPVPLYDALQLWLSIVLGAYALGLWQRMARQRRLWHWRGTAPAELSRAPLGARRALAVWVAASAAAGFATGLRLRPAAEVGLAVELAVYGAIAFTALGLAVVASAERLRGNLARRAPVRASVVVDGAMGS